MSVHVAMRGHHTTGYSGGEIVQPPPRLAALEHLTGASATIRGSQA